MALVISCLAAAAISNKIWGNLDSECGHAIARSSPPLAPDACVPAAPVNIRPVQYTAKDGSESDRTVCHPCSKVANVLLTHKQAEHQPQAGTTCIAAPSLCNMQQVSSHGLRTACAPASLRRANGPIATDND